MIVLFVKQISGFYRVTHDSHYTNKVKEMVSEGNRNED